MSGNIVSNSPKELLDGLEGISRDTEPWYVVNDKVAKLMGEVCLECINFEACGFWSKNDVLENLTLGWKESRDYKQLLYNVKGGKFCDAEVYFISNAEEKEIDRQTNTNPRTTVTQATMKVTGVNPENVGIIWPSEDVN
jgi:hypothetical protein